MNLKRPIITRVSSKGIKIFDFIKDIIISLLAEVTELFKVNSI